MTSEFIHGNGDVTFLIQTDDQGRRLEWVNYDSYHHELNNNRHRKNVIEHLQGEIAIQHRMFQNLLTLYIARGGAISMEPGNVGAPVSREETLQRIRFVSALEVTNELRQGNCTIQAERNA